MSTLGVVNGVLWSVQVFLALFFLAASVPKILGRGIERWTGFSDLPRAEVVFIGVMELFGAIGLVLPMATGIFRGSRINVVVLLRRPARSEAHGA